MGHLRLSGRADLLRALADAHGGDPDAVPDAGMTRLARLLELFPQPPASGDGRHVDKTAGRDAPPPNDDEARVGGGDCPNESPPPARRAPLQARFFMVLASRELPTRDDAASPPEPLQPLTPADCGPRAPGEAPPITPLVPRTRLWPALRRSLSHVHAGGVDVGALVRRLSRAENLRRLPRLTRRGAGGEAWVVFDIARRLIPYEQDLAGIVGEVRRLLGAGKVRLWWVSDSPDAVLTVQHGRGAAVAFAGRIPAPPPGTPVLILGDLGLLSRDGQSAPRWTLFCRRMAAAGARPLAWVPASPRLVSREAARHASVHCLGAGDLHPVKPGRCAEQPPWPDETLHRLLDRMACCVRVEPALLRSLRLVSPDTAAEPGLEALAWDHPADVRAGYRVCEIAASAQARHRAAFAALGATEGGRAEQNETLRRMLALHAYQGRSTESLEALIWRAHAGRLPDEFRPAVERAGEWMARAGLQPDGRVGNVVSYARDLFTRQGGDARLMDEHSARLAPIWAVADVAHIPAGLDSRDVAKALRGPSGGATRRAMELVTENNRPYLIDAKKMKSARVMWHYQDVGKRSDAAYVHWPLVTVPEVFEWSASGGGLRQKIAGNGERLGLPFDGAGPARPHELVAGAQAYRIGGVTRPSWAAEWGMDKDGLYALAPNPFGEPIKLRWSEQGGEDATSGSPPGGRAFQAAPVEVETGIELGADIQFGLYLDVPFGSATQRFRWIEPGEFVMGSPEGEERRLGDEGPQHVVRLREGYWLAETACSQLVWDSVMGSNPSRFNEDSQNPVEQVSWDDVQGFLREVEKRLPGVKADLPTEAEWEYACRAGSEKAFSWGDGITPDQANYDARTSYANGPTGEYRGKTVPVRSYEPNAWGLYQMHGNVWEWCADGLRYYDGAVQVDPRGLAGGEADAPRAVRGGSWIDDPLWLRAAFRFRRLRGERYVDLGFRFSLRSTSQPGGAERPPEAAVAPEHLLAPLDSNEQSSFVKVKLEEFDSASLRKSADLRNTGTGSLLDYMANVIAKPEPVNGPMPWSKLRETIPVGKRSRPKSKYRGEK
ncbi:SUMF1/EgtB/PvdO family nonheme iron enzyme [Zoogloea sp.]|uniref:SUMF1/EgtB/PvdO family nonheme iron enzyme n=1 Tax=Zoogloea sp. TaxID=49181 RepID=UPI0035B2558B